ncbi:MAG TPA: TasA family protein [Candidatus Limnocylindrales bacterium]
MTATTPTFDRPVARHAPLARHRRAIMAAMLGLTTLSLGAGVFSLAIFTDTADATGSFTAGTIDIAASPSVAFTVAAMVPGDTITQAMTIDNDGTADLRWSLSTVATDPLGDALTLTVRQLGTSCAAFDGSVVLAATALDGASIGDEAQGDDTGDRDLSAAASEVLCFRVSLPLATGDALQGATSDATFTFDAEQVDNNP